MTLVWSLALLLGVSVLFLVVIVWMTRVWRCEVWPTRSRVIARCPLCGEHFRFWKRHLRRAHATPPSTGWIR